MPGTYLITGATGFVGSHVADALAGRGETIHALARASSETDHLRKLGARVFQGDVTERAAVDQAMQGVEVVIHCAAKVGDWGAVEEYRAVNVEGLRNLLEASRGRNLRCFVHLSSLGVYEARHHYGTDETEPLPESHVDGYTQSKVEAEQLALAYHQQHGIPVVVLRPGFIYGPRDRTLLPTMVKNLKRRVVRYVGGGRSALNTTYVGNLVDAILLAVEQPKAVGQVYNITDGEFVTKRKFFETVASSLGLKPPMMGGPLWGAKIIAKSLEKRARRLGWTEPPRLTMARLKFLGMNLDFSIAKARKELGYNPRVGFDEGIKKALDWYKQAYPEYATT
jgi:nucleoside-diphosphate-sugar epimerase